MRQVSCQQARRKGRPKFLTTNIAVLFVLVFVDEMLAIIIHINVLCAFICLNQY